MKANLYEALNTAPREYKLIFAGIELVAKPQKEDLIHWAGQSYTVIFLIVTKDDLKIVVAKNTNPFKGILEP